MTKPKAGRRAIAAIAAGLAACGALALGGPAPAAAQAALQDKDKAAAATIERAAMMLHAPDTEMGLVRSYMQAGHYRRALAFCAHTAGVHREASVVAALWRHHLADRKPFPCMHRLRSSSCSAFGVLLSRIWYSHSDLALCASSSLTSCLT